MTLLAQPAGKGLGRLLLQGLDMNTDDLRHLESVSQLVDEHRTILVGGQASIDGL
jgi:hypothetical protein